MPSQHSSVDELKVPRADPAAAAGTLLASFEEDANDEADVAAAWVAEIERRVAADEPGIPLDQALAEGRARLRLHPHDRSPR